MSLKALQSDGVDIVVQGRMVWGGVKVGNKVNFNTKQVELDPKTGQPITEWKFGLAIPKPGPQSTQHEIENFQKFWNAVHQQAAAIGVAQYDQKFHWKFEDGDGVKKDNTPYADHSKGCYILACKTYFPLKIMAWENGVCRQATEEEIECGYYVQVALNIRAHGGVNAGLYINPSFVARFAYGTKIVNAPDAASVLGSAPPPMFAGGSATPIGAAPNFPGQQAPQGFAAPGYGPSVSQAPQQQPNWQGQQHPGGQQAGFNPGFNQAPGAGQPNQVAPNYQPNPAVLPQQFQHQGPGQFQQPGPGMAAPSVPGYNQAGGYQQPGPNMQPANNGPSYPQQQGPVNAGPVPQGYGQVPQQGQPVNVQVPPGYVYPQQ